ncbi:DUF1194 domain-containing protein [Denitrobaculum tricleocarpae]|uniref:DUF1194 domain-containing protein n=1 Tax=Denitrobaculum tricleocarpae TaxID=2591009 RepID=UPI0015D45913|nr:DUF1194 domain-containing protein [Denitrobaculum tricleocarpae]
MISTDVNLITAVDVSDSITRHEEWLQYTGLARGVVDPHFLSLVDKGLTQRIGFMAFTWSSGGQVRVIVPWAEVADREDAAEVAAQLSTAPRIDRAHYVGHDQAPDAAEQPVSLSAGGRTDVSQAVAIASRFARSAPFQGRRTIINILSNGADNIGSEPNLQRDEAIRQGATINGVVFGGRRDLPAYFEQNVIGGPGAFLMTVHDPADLPEALERKFWHDLLAASTALGKDGSGASSWQ